MGTFNLDFNAQAVESLLILSDGCDCGIYLAGMEVLGKNGLVVCS